MMKVLFVLVAPLLAAVPFVAADVIPEGSAAHFFSSQNSTLVFGPQSAAAKADLVAQLAGDGSSNDRTALFATFGTGVPGQIAFGDWCITANGVEPGSASQTLYVDDCSDDPKQLWTVNADPPTVSNADGNCLTLGRAWTDVPVTLAECNDVLQHLQLWNPIVV
ncbi:hypothetical protein V8D89_003322 [Ganoderma adspersum]